MITNIFEKLIVMNIFEKLTVTNIFVKLIVTKIFRKVYQGYVNRSLNSVFSVTKILQTTLPPTQFKA